MRDALRSLGPPPDHPALAYDAWAPIGAEGTVPNEVRATWLERLSNRPVTSDYARALDRWRSSFHDDGDRTFELELAARLLVGHGNNSATDVGLTLHHTWGVPVIPGTALKGLLAHYVDAVYGPEDPHVPPWERTGPDRERTRWEGVTWSDNRIRRGPGDLYRVLFGAPDADADGEMAARGLNAGAAAGVVSFHDALYVVPDKADGDCPFAKDVLTVHQKTYYDEAGKSFPNDYDDPNPVAFLSVRPGARFLFALSGPAAWTELAERLLVDALREWGVGGKTSSGYGRFVRPGERRPAAAGGARAGGAAAHPTGPRYQRGARIVVVRVEDPSGRGKVKFRADDGFLGHFAGEPPPDVAIDAAVEVWVANVQPEAYTLTLRPPPKKRG